MNNQSTDCVYKRKYLNVRSNDKTNHENKAIKLQLPILNIKKKINCMNGEELRIHMGSRERREDIAMIKGS